MRSAPVLRRLLPLAAAVICLAAAAPASAVRLAISSASVSQPGESTRVCVSLSTGGQEVAGTQNDLVWDGTCMTVNDGDCFAVGSHGKQVNSRIQNSADFRMRVLVLSLSDVDPIDDGMLYCCNVQAEAEGGSCCSIAVVNTGASDSKGNAISGVGGNSGQVCVAGGGNNGGGAIGGVVGGQQLGASNDAAPYGQPAAAAPAAAGVGAGAPAPAAPAAQVLQGGGGGAQVPTAPVGAAPPPPIAAPPTQPPVAATRAAVVASPPPIVPTPAAVIAPPTAAAPTVAPTAGDTPKAADTPTAAAPAAAPPTKAPASTPTAARSTPTASRGWFGCQIDPGASVAPPLSLALLLVGIAGARRLRCRRH